MDIEKRNVKHWNKQYFYSNTKLTTKDDKYQSEIEIYNVINKFEVFSHLLHTMELNQVLCEF